MNLSLTNKAKAYIKKQLENSKEQSVILVYQFNRESCAGSYLDYYIDIDKLNRVIQLDNYEKWKTLSYITNDNIDVYIEKRILPEFNEDVDVLIDAITHKKFDDEFIELIFKPAIQD